MIRNEYKAPEIKIATLNEREGILAAGSVFDSKDTQEIDPADKTTHDANNALTRQFTIWDNDEDGENK